MVFSTEDFFLRLRDNSIKNINSSFCVMREIAVYTKTPIEISAKRMKSFNANFELGSKKVKLNKYTAIPMTPDMKNSLMVDDNIFRPPINPILLLSK